MTEKLKKALEEAVTDEQKKAVAEKFKEEIQKLTQEELEEIAGGAPINHGKIQVENLIRRVKS